MHDRRSEVTSQNRTQSICPFLSEEEGSAQCLSRSAEPSQVAPAYVGSICLKSRHFTCPRYLRADADARRAARERESASPGEPAQATDRRPIPSSSARTPTPGAPQQVHAGGTTPPTEQGPPRMPPIRHPASEDHTGPNLTLWGTSTPGGSIDVLDGVKHLASADVDDAGFWGAMLHDLAPGTHVLRARTFVEGGTVSRFSLPVSIEVESSPSAPGESASEIQADEGRLPLTAAPQAVESGKSTSINGSSPSE